MRIKDRLNAVEGVKVSEWRVTPVQMIGGYAALMDIEDQVANATYGVGLTWENGRWKLKTDAPVFPPYIRETIDQKE